MHWLLTQTFTTRLVQKYQKEIGEFRNKLNKSPKGKQRSGGAEFELTRDKVSYPPPGNLPHVRTNASSTRTAMPF